MKLSTLVAALLAASPLITTAQTTNDTKANQGVARHFFERSNANDISGMLSDLAEDAKNFGRSVGRHGYRRALEDIFPTLPDWPVDILDQVTEGDAAVLRSRATGT